MAGGRRHAMSPKKIPKHPVHDETRPPFAGPLRQRLKRAGAFDLREWRWGLIDAWEARRAVRLAVYSTAFGLALVVVAWVWGYPWWTERNAFRMARQWIEAGRIRNAAELTERILVDQPGNPASWRLAAEIARIRQNKTGAVGYSRRAAGLAPDRPAFTVEWAGDALVADQPEEAIRILGTVAPAEVAASAQAQRILGEIARRRFQLAAARDYFSAALELGGATAINEIPLGAVLLNANLPAERARGLTLLARWSGDPAWGADALRFLLSDALARDDRAALLRWAEPLRAHPRCTLGDVPNCLLALARADPDRFATVLAGLERRHSVNGDQAALLLDWLVQIGRPGDAARWARSLPPAISQKYPVIVPVAEALRQTADWAGLDAWVNAGDWRNDIEVIRLAYALQAARATGQSAAADGIWSALRAAAQAQGARALFAANLLYVWGARDEGLELLWLAADQAGVAVDALATLARHYQVLRDATGQYRAFQRLHSLRPQDRDIANNYAFFATLLGKDTVATQRLVEDNRLAAPHHVAYRATAAFLLLMRDRTGDALALLRPVSGVWRDSPATTFAYGLALAGSGRKPEARPILATLDPASLTTAEVELLKRFLD